MATLPGLDKGVFQDPNPPAVDSQLSPLAIPNGTLLVTTKPYNEIIDNVNQLIDYVSGDAGSDFIPQLAIDGLVSDLAARELLVNKVTTIGTPGNDTNYGTEKAIRDALNLKEDSLGFTPEDSANKGAINGYAGLDASQELLLVNFPSGTALQVLRRNAGNTALEFFTLSDLQGIVSINADTTAAQIIAGTASRITVGTAAGTTTIDIDAAYVGQTSITTLGTITAGVWNGTDIDGANIDAELTDLSDVTAKTGTGTVVVMDTSPTIVTPTIVSFVNATHNHESAAGGGTLLSTAALSDTSTIAYLNTANAWTTGLQDFSAVTLRIPVSATPSVTVDGDIAYDSSVTDFTTGLIKFFGTEEQGIVAMPIAQFTTPSDGFVVTYNATNDEFELSAAGVGDMVLAAIQTVTGAKTFEDTTFFLRNVDDTFSASFVNTITVDRIYTLPDAAGTVVITGLASQITLGNEVTGAITDLSDVTAKTGTGTIVVFNDTPTIITPTIASFVNATHNHETAAGGGQLLSTSALSDTADIAYLNTDNTFLTNTRQTFTHQASKAGIALAAIAGDVTAPNDGEFWYNLTTDKFRARENGVTVDMIGTGGAGSLRLVKLEGATISTDREGLNFADTGTINFTVTDDAGNDEADVIAAIVNDSVVDDQIGTHTSTKITITAKGQLNSAIVYNDQANTYTGGGIQDFNNSRITNVQNLSFDGTPATIGTIRLNSTNSISSRNAANTDNVVLIQLTGTNIVAIGGANDSGVLINNFLQIGFGGAQSGVIRFKNEDELNWRNFANSSDLGIKFDLNDAFTFTGTTEIFGEKIFTNHPTITTIDTINDRLLILDATDNTINQVSPENLGLVTLTGTETLTNKTLTDPVIASFVNATHNHEDAAGGGQLDSTLALSDTATIAYLNTPNVYTAGTRQDFLSLLAGTAGLNVGGIAGNPTTQVNGDVWLNTSINQILGRINGVDVDLGDAGITSINGETGAGQTIAGTTNRIDVVTTTDTQTLDIDAAYVGQTSITTLGTITIGVWNGTAITGANINAASTDLTDTAVIVRTNQANVFGDFIQTFKDNSITIESPDGLTPTTLVNAQQTLARNLTIPILTANRSIVVTGETSQITLGTEVTGAITDLSDVTAKTGTGTIVVFDTSPTLVTPNLGTPSTLILTNATGLPLTTGVTGTLPVANGGTGVTTSTGTVNVVLSDNPTIVTPTIVSFVNANHNHEDAAGGGVLGKAAIPSVTVYEDEANTWGAFDQNIAVTGKWQEAGVNISPIGVHDIGLPATAYFLPTFEPASPLTNFNSPINDIDKKVFEFTSTTADERIQTTIYLPRNWDEGTVDMEFYWSFPSGTGDVRWAVRFGATGNNETIDNAFAAATAVNDTAGTPSQLQKVVLSGIVMPAGILPGDEIQIEIFREGSNVGDTFTGTARLHGTVLMITTDAAVAG